MHAHVSHPVSRSCFAVSGALRRFASSPRTRATEASRPLRKPSSLPQRQQRPIDPSLTPGQANKQYYGAKLLAAGQEMIYKAPSHTGLLGASWFIAGSCFVTSAALAFGNLWLYDPDSDLPTIVRVGHRLGIITFTAVGGIALLRPLNLVKSMRLINSDTGVKLLVQVRRPAPFLPPKQYIIAPHELRVDRTWVHELEIPEFIQESTTTQRGVFSWLGQSISRAFYYPFAATRQLMTLEGIINASLKEGGPKVKLDSHGTFSNGGEDIERLGTIIL
ncbi:hypothetical protein RBB50_010294 [Rhinocladiella similis]